MASCGFNFSLSGMIMTSMATSVVHV